MSEAPTDQANTTVTGSKPAPGTKPSAGEGRSSSRGVPPELIPASERATPTYYAIAQRIEPAARRHCRAAGLPNCNFTFLADIALGRPSNAWHTRDGTRPIVIVSLPFFEEVENVDQLAFVLGHEVAHHILNHNPRGQVDIQTSALTEALDAHRTGGNVEDAEPLPDTCSTARNMNWKPMHWGRGLPGNRDLIRRRVRPILPVA
ncbi:M48 family metalloprotease [Thalassobius sp. I31.1]|uniref:M48 family metalloprotease n=1 Tax=Thalassobius sp. I31.1 TaxID=2109912 RepID=UPI001300222F|nr:M48 family metalloprotease [Thalassobius sp. I31.1]